VETIKTRTAQGRGRWGQDVYEFELVTTVQTRWDVTGSTSRSTTGFSLVCSQPAGPRYFASEADRDAFVAVSFSQLDLEPVDPAVVWSEASALHTVLGLPVAEVELAHECVRLLWAEDWLDVFSTATFVTGGARWADAHPEFATRVRSLTGQVLSGTDELLGRGLVLTFEGGDELEVSLQHARPGVVEAAESRGGLWLVGELPFDGAPVR
jgi:hypothetical protein